MVTEPVILAAMPLSDDEKAAVLARLPLFAGVSSDSLTRLTAVAGEQDFAAGQYIVRQGQVGTGLYVLLEGRVRVMRGSDELAVLAPGGPKCRKSSPPVGDKITSGKSQGAFGVLGKGPRAKEAPARKGQGAYPRRQR